MLLTQFSLACLLSLSGMHDLYVGVTNIDINQENGIVEVVFKLDRKDLEYVFLHNYLYNVNFNQDRLSEKEIKFVIDYVNKTFTLKFNNRQEQLDFFKHEFNEQEVWLYFNQKINIQIDSVLVRNLLLLDVNLKQKNIVFIKTSGFLEGYLLDKDNYKINVNISGREE